MQVTVRFFALGRELAGIPETLLDLEEGSTVKDAMQEVRRRFARIDELNSFLLAVNMTYARPEQELRAGDVLAIIPPVSGG